MCLSQASRTLTRIPRVRQTNGADSRNLNNPGYRGCIGIMEKKMETTI